MNQTTVRFKEIAEVFPISSEEKADTRSPSLKIATGKKPSNLKEIGKRENFSSKVLSQESKNAFQAMSTTTASTTFKSNQNQENFQQKYSLLDTKPSLKRDSQFQNEYLFKDINIQQQQQQQQQYKTIPSNQKMIGTVNKTLDKFRSKSKSKQEEELYQEVDPIRDLVKMEGISRVVRYGEARKKNPKKFQDEKLLGTYSVLRTDIPQVSKDIAYIRQVTQSLSDFRYDMEDFLRERGITSDYQFVEKQEQKYSYQMKIKNPVTKQFCEEFTKDSIETLGLMEFSVNKKRVHPVKISNIFDLQKTINYEIKTFNYFSPDCEVKVLHYFQPRTKYIYFIDVEELDRGYLTYQPINTRESLIKVTVDINFNISQDSKSIITPDGDIYLTCGKASPNGYSKSMHWLDYEEMKLEQKKDMNIYRYRHGVVYLGEYIYVIGGKGENDKAIASCERYNIEKENWELICSLLTGVSDMGLCSWNERFLFKFGGINEYGFLNKQIEKYVPEVNKWYEVNYNSESENLTYNYSTLCLQINNQDLYIFGGQTANDMCGDEAKILRIHDSDNEVVNVELGKAKSFNTTISSQPLFDMSLPKLLYEEHDDDKVILDVKSNFLKTAGKFYQLSPIVHNGSVYFLRIDYLNEGFTDCP